MSKINLTLVNGNLASYPIAGGHWSAFMQYILGLLDLNIDCFWIEMLNTTGSPNKDKWLMNTFFTKFKKYGLGERCAILLTETENSPTLEEMKVFGISGDRFIQLLNHTDILWNFCCTIKNPFLGMFNHCIKVLIDLDPGILQINDIEWNLGIDDHDIFFTVGTKIRDTDCKVPTLGKKWNTFFPPIFLPMWEVTDNRDLNAPFTSITQWTWVHFCLYKNEMLSLNKRDAYLRYITIPLLCQYPFELAANIHPKDKTGDREKLKSNGWKLTHPHIVSKSIQSYQHYIRYSRGEFSCAKPIYTQLRTGWFSDRSAAYLASGRPVIAEDTGFSAHLPADLGLIKFENVEEALEGIEMVTKDYSNNQKAARRLAEEYLDSKLVLSRMLSLCK